MTATTQEVIERFKALHEFDLRLLRLEVELERTPAALEEFQEAVRAADIKIKTVDGKVQILRAQIRLRENDLRSKEQKVAKLKEQSSEVRSNKEFVAFRSEIANAQGEADRIQSEILKIMEVVEAADAKIAEFAEERTRREERVEAARRDMEARLSDVKEQRDMLVAERPTHMEGLPKEPLDSYERTRRKSGKGAAILEGAYCGACGDMLTRNEVYAVQNRTKILFCRSCASLLYIP